MAEWASPGNVAYSAVGNKYVSPQYPACNAGDRLLLVVAYKPSSSGRVNAPAGWSPVAQRTDAGGYGGAYGSDIGNTSLHCYERDVPDGGLVGGQTVSFSDSGVAWAIILRVTSSHLPFAATAATTGEDVAAGDVDIVFDGDPGVVAGDLCIVAMSIPTDETTPNQFSGEAIAQPGVQFGDVAESAEPDTANGDDIGGVICYATAASGASAGAPQFTAVASGPTTNVRGPALFIRLRDASAPTPTPGGGRKPWGRDPWGRPAWGRAAWGRAG
ncbi:hypothetical protein DDE01_11980 [Desulfovibrio desulfuricans]|nr:hypothetical protein DDE01_11980 [Desulfovibrio desulfuricans]